ncbi:MAG TPA: OsmC family protein [Thermoanaerobaculia bacterium]|nr:OsmC family protein [Thermoanaerobaculia bacterium]
MPSRKAEAEWKGNLKDGKGTLRTESGAADGAYSFVSRFETGSGTNPEELIAAAHAGCFSMALSNGLSKAGHEPESVHTEATIHLEKVGEGFEITRIDLVCNAKVPGISDEDFQKEASSAKENCPVSKLLRTAEITLKATLKS